MVLVMVAEVLEVDANGRVRGAGSALEEVEVGVKVGDVVKRRRWVDVLGRRSLEGRRGGGMVGRGCEEVIKARVKEVERVVALMENKSNDARPKGLLRLRVSRFRGRNRKGGTGRVQASNADARRGLGRAGGFSSSWRLIKAAMFKLSLTAG
jgi:hypothetical protein